MAKAEIFFEKSGYFFGYLLFTTGLFIILRLTSKIPEAWGYIHVMAITASITIISIILSRWLKRGYVF